MISKVKNIFKLWFDCFKFSVLFDIAISDREDILKHRKNALTVGEFFDKMWQLNIG